MKAKNKVKAKMNRCRFHKGDEVIITTGRSKGESGKIDSIDIKNHRVFISGKNLVKRHTKPDISNEGGIVDKPMSIHISNVQILDPKSKKATRIGTKTTDGKKTRVARSSGSPLV